MRGATGFHVDVGDERLRLVKTAGDTVRTPHTAPVVETDAGNARLPLDEVPDVGAT